MVLVVFSCRNGICKLQPSPYILCAVKGFNACSWHVQHRHGRTPEKLLQMTIQMPNYRPNLLWSEMSMSFWREEQAYRTTATQGTRQGLWVCTNTSAFPASAQNVAAASVWATRNKTFTWWNHSARFSWPCTYLIGTLWLHSLLREGWRGPFSRRAAEFNHFLSAKMWTVPFVCKWCWAHFSHPSEGLQVVQ